MYEYRAEVLRIIDGDSLILRVDMGFRMYAETYFRLKGINTPEIRGPEREAGLRAKRYVEDMIPPGEIVTIRTHKAGKYGRWLCEIETTDGHHLNKLLVQTGHAKPYMV